MFLVLVGFWLLCCLCCRFKLGYLFVSLVLLISGYACSFLVNDAGLFGFGFSVDFGF